MGHSLLRVGHVSIVCPTLTNYYDYVFAENGLVAYKDGKLIGTQEFINFTLHYIADLDIPIKRNIYKVPKRDAQCITNWLKLQPGRTGRVLNIRPKMVSVLREKFAHLNLTLSIRGQIIQYTMEFSIAIASREPNAFKAIYSGSGNKILGIMQVTEYLQFTIRFNSRCSKSYFDSRFDPDLTTMQKTKMCWPLRNSGNPNIFFQHLNHVQNGKPHRNRSMSAQNPNW
ncbi:hypothetical protein HYC85_009222 [Camellia sinensis]|uniref:Phosphomannomutase n=1 Tax=Camellia sinensis TaxID=4442 RepID=A0A7J7HH11_CAMSI|nr:hypothetical protein HYC85_009222 [Camellia sinensis]